MRVHQWVKNMFIFLPIFFGLKITQLQLVFNSAHAFLGFSMIASSVYIFNDMLDIEEDRLHPTKKNRPLAAGLLSVTDAYIAIAVLVLGGLSIFYFSHFSLMAWGLVLFYIVQNILYTIKLKHIALVDITIISLGFVIRILLGGAVTGTYLTHWIIMMTFLLAMFLALAKRRDDVIIFARTGTKTRKNIEGYNLDLLNALMTIMSAIVIVAYILYTTSVDVIERFGHYTYLTSFFVILGIMRYLQITYVQEQSGNPTKILLKDRFLQVIIVGWVTSFVLILYSHF